MLPGRLSGPMYWQQLSQLTKTARLALTPENSPNEFLYNFDKGRFTAGNVPPVLIATLPHLSDDPDAIFDKLAETVCQFPTQTVEQHHAMLFEQLTNMFGRSAWIERSGMSISYIRLLPNLFPHSKIVLMYRDGRDVVLSYRKFPAIWPMIWTWYWSQKLGFNLLNPKTPIGRSKWLAFNETFFVSKALLRWMLSTPPSIEVCAAFWSQTTLQSLAEYKALPKNKKIFLRFETLISTPEKELTALTGFLAVEAKPDWMKKAADIPKSIEPRWKKLGQQDLVLLENVTSVARKAVECALP